MVGSSRVPNGGESIAQIGLGRITGQGTDHPGMREELITITRMLLGLTPAVKGDLPAPEKKTEETPVPATPAEPAAEATQD